MKNYKFLLQGLECANCAKKIEDKIAANPEYKDVVVNFSTITLSFKTDKEKGVEEDIKNIVKAVEPDTVVISKDKKQVEQVQRNNKDIIRLFVGLAIYGLSVLLQKQIILSYILLVISAITLLYRTAIKAYKQLKGKILDENTLIIVSVIGACLVGKTMEGIMVITLYEIGKILEARAVNKTRKSISSLMDIKPEYANLKIGDEIKQVSPEEVEIGKIIVIKAGEKIPLDGEIILGDAKINNSALTGESRLIDSTIGDKVLSGGIVSEGLVEIKVEKTYENSTVAQILNLVENATDKKARTETFVNKASSIYTPIVIGLAAILAIFLPLFTDIAYTGNNGSIYRALIFLVISCPCSIAISVPLSYFSGIGKSSKEGILIKGSDYIDAIKDIKEIVFDKTGTLTKGEFDITKIETFENYSEQEVLKYAAMGEKYSNHPIAKSIMKANKEDISEVQDFKEIAGKGLSYQYNGETVLVGNSVLVGANDANEEGATKIYVKINDKLAGIIYLGDTVKDGVVETIKELKALGIKTNMFTGDNKQIAEKTGKEIGIQNIKSEMLPQDKYNAFEEIINKKDEKTKVAFVGDGINDSPVLARADVGISMGGVGSESAIEASDVVIMTDNVSKILDAIKISKKTCGIIRQNLVFAITVKVLILFLSTIGLSGMWQAVFADVGVTILTIFNTLRILK